jgi:hypothetical protein
MGCSVLSIVEIFYAFFAWCFDKNKTKRRKKSNNFKSQFDVEAQKFQAHQRKMKIQKNFKKLKFNSRIDKNFESVLPVGCFEYRN